MKVTGNTLALSVFPTFGTDVYVARATSAAKTSFEQHKPPEYIPPKVWQSYFRPFSGDVAEMEKHMYRASYDLSKPPYTWDTDNPGVAEEAGYGFYYAWSGDRVFVHVDSQEGYPFLARGIVVSLQNQRGRIGIDLRNDIHMDSEIPAKQFKFTLQLKHPSMLVRGMHRLFFYKGPQLELTGDQWTVWREGVRYTFGPQGPFPI